MEVNAFNPFFVLLEPSKPQPTVRPAAPSASLELDALLERIDCQGVHHVATLGTTAPGVEIRWPRWAELVPGYAVGTLGALWFIERTAILMGWM